MKKISLNKAISFLIFALVLEFLLLTRFQVAHSYGSVLKSQYIKASLSHLYKSHHYKINNYVVTLELPEGSEVHVTPDQGQEMLFNIYFTNKNMAFRGYIQIWKIKDLEAFLNNSKSLSPFDFIFYNMDRLQQDGSTGFQTQWSADFDEKYISGKEYWMTMGQAEEVIRLSFFTDSKEFPVVLEEVAEHMRKSLKVDNKDII